VTVIALDKFQGEIPRLPPHLLPDENAQRAINCEFSYGELRSLRGYGQVRNACQPPATVFSTGDGRMFSWPIPTRAYLSPTIDDIYGRVYFNNTDGLFVTTKSQAYNPAAVCAPVNFYRVGLPVPGTTGNVNITASAVNITATPSLQVEVNGAVTGIVPITQVDTIKPNEEWVLYFDPNYNIPGMSGSDYDAYGNLRAAVIEGTGFIDSNFYPDPSGGSDGGGAV